MLGVALARRARFDEGVLPSTIHHDWASGCLAAGHRGRRRWSSSCMFPLGNYMARVYSDTGHWRVERVIYRSDRCAARQPAAVVEVTASRCWRFSAVSVLFLYGLLLAQTSTSRTLGS